MYEKIIVTIAVVFCIGMTIYALIRAIGMQSLDEPTERTYETD